MVKRTSKTKATKKIFFDWKIQLEKVQLTRGLKDDTTLYQGKRVPLKND